jgi:peroxiredoxin
MAVLAVGTKAPDFTLHTSDGKQFSLKEALARGPVMLAFFKISCPVCQYAFPFYERLYKAYKNQGVTLVGVSQNDMKDTTAFARQYGVTFPVLLDEKKNQYPVSNAYGLTNVPTVFWIAQDGTIAISSVGWDRKDYEAAGRKMAEVTKVPAALLIAASESVADFRAG